MPGRPGCLLSEDWILLCDGLTAAEFVNDVRFEGPKA